MFDDAVATLEDTRRRQQLQRLLEALQARGSRENATPDRLCQSHPLRVQCRLAQSHIGTLGRHAMPKQGDFKFSVIGARRQCVKQECGNTREAFPFSDQTILRQQ